MNILKSVYATALIASCSMTAPTVAGLVAPDEIVGEIDASKITKMSDSEVKNLWDSRKDLGLLFSNWTTGFTANANANGQNGWGASGGTVTGTSNYRITATRPGGQSGQGLAITKSSTATRWLYQSVTTAFNARPATEQNVWSDFSIYYDGGATAPANSARGGSMDSNGVNWTAGAGIDFGTLSTTYVAGRLRGYAYLTAAAAGGTAGSYAFNLGAVVSGAQWVNFSTMKELATGRVNWFYSLDGGTTWVGLYFDAGQRTISTMEFDYALTNTGVSTSQTVNFGSMALYTTPAPGAIALLGVAGLVGARRRR
jgi:hypothetical protein